MTGLYIGRFQPFHLGHLDAVTQVLAREDRMILAIGSSRKSRETENPFSAAERRDMIQAGLDEAGIDPARYEIVEVPNIDDYPAWPAHVEKTCPPFDRVYTGSDIVAGLFEQHSHIPVVRLKLDRPISATKVRAALKAGESVKSLVQNAILGYLASIKATDILNSLPHED